MGRTARPIRAIGALGMVAGLLLVPPVFNAFFAVGPLLAGEERALWVAAGLLFGVSATIAAVARGPALAALLFAALVCIGIELGARTVVKIALGEDMRAHLEWLANGTYPERMIIKGHPFLHYASNGEGNNLGFFGDRDYVREKPRNTIRVACLGGSTTANKWPRILERNLNERTPGDAPRFEVLDFGQNGYSTAHLVVNYALNVAEHDPDYVILHTGWNDSVLRGLGDIKSDYSNVFKTFEYPSIPDAWLLRTSTIYRYLQHRYYGYPPWANIRNALDITPSSPPSYDDRTELQPFVRNVEKLVRFSRASGSRTVLATLPHTTAEDVAIPGEAIHIDQCNEEVRRIATASPDDVLLVDLDRLMTGKYDHLFQDLGHLNTEGHEIKAEALADAILGDLDARDQRE